MQESGLHKIDDASLSAYPSSAGKKLCKKDVNIEALRDFVVMNNCRTLVGDGLSLFSLMAYGLKSNQVYLSDLPSPGSQGNTSEIYRAKGFWRF